MFHEHTLRKTPLWGSTYAGFSAFLFVLAVALYLSGCGDKKKEKKKPTSTAATKAASIEGLQAVPASASAVIGIDVAKLSSSPVVLRAVERMFARDVTLKEDLNAVLGACEFDFAKDFASATVAIVPRPVKDGESSDDSLLVANGRFNEATISACLGRFLSERGGRLEQSEAQGRRLYHEIASSKDGATDGRWFAFGSSNTLLVSSGRDVLVSALGDGPKMVDQKDGLAQLIPEAKLDAGIWAIARIDGAVAAGMAAATEGKVTPAKSVVGFAELEEGLSLELKAEMASEKDAKMLISIISDQLSFAAAILQVDSAGRLVKKIEVSSNGNWAQIAWSLTEEELADLMESNLLGGESDVPDEEFDGSASAAGSTIDIPDRNDKNPALAPVSGAGQERETKNGKHTDPDRKEEFRKQSKAHQ